MNGVTYTRLPASGWIEVGFGYDPEIIDVIKKAVPAAFRSYSKSERRWSISPVYLDTLKAAFATHRLMNPHGAAAKTLGTTMTAEKTAADFYRLLPPEIRSQAHKALVEAANSDPETGYRTAQTLAKAWQMVNKGVAA